MAELSREEDDSGRFIPSIWTEDDIADAKQRLASDEPRYTTSEVLEYLRSLE